MHKANIEFKKIFERDMDFLIIEEFISDRGFARLFLDKLHLSDDYIVSRASHSLSDSDGESDITIILRYPEKSIAILIEDKIDAPTMQQQSVRYDIRGNSGKERGEYDVFFVFLAAPEDYHKEHWNDINADYEHRINYEEIREYLANKGDMRSSFKTAIIDCALREKMSGYQVRVNEYVTEFWVRLRQYCREKFPHLEMVGVDSPKGTSAAWPEFRTGLGNLKVIYKSQKGCVDLEFPQYGDRRKELFSILGERLPRNSKIEKTGKSASIRLSNKTWQMDFTSDFEECKDILDEVLQAVSTLCEFASTLHYWDFY